MNNLQIIEHSGQRVLTTAQLAQAYNTEEVNIRKNFSNNKERVKEGEHYYSLKGRNLAEFKNSVKDIHSVGKNANSLILWTHKGASRHCKMLDTDEAWAQFDVLEETYFKARETFQIPQTLPEALRYAAELAEQIEQHKPLVAFAETAARSQDSILVRELAKICCNTHGLEMGQNKLYRKLRGWKLLMHNNEPYQEYVNRGYFEVTEGTHETDKGVKLHKTTRILPKGQQYIISRLTDEST